MLNLHLQAGGAERQLVQLAKYWRRTDWQLSTILLERQGVWIGELPDDVRLWTCSEKMPSGKMAKVLWALRLVPRLRRFFRDNKCDAVLTFLWLPTVLVALALRGVRKRPLIVWSVQSDVGQDFKSRRDGQLRGLLVRTILSKEVDHFIAISQGIRQRTELLLGVPKERFSIIPNSIDIKRINEQVRVPDSLVPKQGNIRIVTVGRLHPVKDMDVLLKAVAIARKSRADIECYFIGDGPDKARLLSLVNDLDLVGDVHFIGYAHNPYAWLASADIFVSSSRWETFGIAIAEAMAIGIPVIATATDGAGYLISDGVDGLVVPIGNVKALAGAILKLARDTSLCRQLGACAREKVISCDAPRIAHKYEMLLERLLSKR
jgi:glycosyltransferase involved in cell wall biosynthesis